MSGIAKPSSALQRTGTPGRYLSIPNPLNMRFFSILSIFFFVLTPESASAQDDPWLGLVPEVVHSEGELAGMTTYRLYLYTPNETDFLVSCSGDDDNPLVLASSTEPSWFQHEAATTAFATDVNPIFFAAFPEFAFDSWLTIGAEDNTAAVDIINLDDPTFAAFTAFEAGQSIEVTGSIGSAWFVLPIPTNVEAIAGSDLRILVAQLTTAGDISGQIQCQIFLEGSNENEFRAVLPIGFACNDPDNANYNPDALNADGCEYPDGLNEVRESLPIAMHPNPATDMVTVTFPESLNPNGVGAELQAWTLQGQLAGTWGIQSNVERIDVSGMAAGHYLMSVSGTEGQKFSGSLVVSK